MIIPHKSAIHLTLCAGLCWTSGCSQTKPSIDVAAAFNQNFVGKRVSMQFSAPSALHYLLTKDAGLGGNIDKYQREACLLQRLILTKKVTFQPRPELSPFWILNVGSIKNYGEVVDIDFGARTFQSARDGKRWSDGPNEFYAESVLYTISGSESLDKPYDFGPFTMRVVFINNPAVGRWQIQSATPDDARITSGNNDGEVAEAINEMGLSECDPEPVKSAMNEAIAIALEAQASQVTETTGVSQDKIGAVWSSDSIGKKFALADNSIIAKPGIDSFTRAAAVCDGMKILGLKWDVPTIPQLKTLLHQSRRGGGLEELADTADHRYWVPLLDRVPPSVDGINKSVNIVSSQIEPEGGTHIVAVYKDGGAYTDLIWGSNTDYEWQVICVSK